MQSRYNPKTVRPTTVFRRIPLFLVCLLAGPCYGQARSDVAVPEMVRVPAGEFLMGSEEGASWEKPAHPVEISSFRIARRPISNAEYRAFRPDYRNPVDNADQSAVRGISWEDATAYCQWLSAQSGQEIRLPSEAEWERAIRGGLVQKKYPWGDDAPVPEDLVASRSAWPPAPPNPFGVTIEYELWEWTADLYDRNYYQQSPQKDPKGASEGEFRVLRGGSYPNDPNSMRCANRGSARPKTVLPNVSFRIARSDTPKEISQARPPRPGDMGSDAVGSEAGLAAAARRVSSLPSSKPSTGLAAMNPPAVRDADAYAAPAAPRPAQGPVALSRVDVSTLGKEVIVSLTLSGAARYALTEMTAPDRLVVDLAGTAVKTDRQYGSTNVNWLGVQRVRWAPFDASEPKTRLVIDLEQPLRYTVDSTSSGLALRLSPR